MTERELEECMKEYWSSAENGAGVEAMEFHCSKYLSAYLNMTKSAAEETDGEDKRDGVAFNCCEQICTKPLSVSSLYASCNERAMSANVEH